MRRDVPPFPRAIRMYVLVLMSVLLLLTVNTFSWFTVIFRCVRQTELSSWRSIACTQYRPTTCKEVRTPESKQCCSSCAARRGQVTDTAVCGGETRLTRRTGQLLPLTLIYVCSNGTTPSGAWPPPTRVPHPPIPQGDVPPSCSCFSNWSWVVEFPIKHFFLAPFIVHSYAVSRPCQFSNFKIARETINVAVSCRSPVLGHTSCCQMSCHFRLGPGYISVTQYWPDWCFCNLILWLRWICLYLNVLCTEQ
jgi:hypothetical protein